MPWQCPKCESKELIVEVVTTAELTQHDKDNQVFLVGDLCWDDHSHMRCRTCNFNASARKFKYKEPKWRQLSDKEFEVLLDFATRHGRIWKRELRRAWLTDGRVTEQNTIFRVIRNELGPEWLEHKDNPISTKIRAHKRIEKS
jgi:DNA-binding response OmpR family regulator